MTDESIELLQKTLCLHGIMRDFLMLNAVRETNAAGACGCA